MLVDQLREGVVSRLFLLAVTGPPESIGPLSSALAARLRDDRHFTSVANGSDLGLSRDQALLWDHRYLLSPGVTAARFTVAGLRAALDEDLGLLASDAGMLVGRTLATDPTGELRRLLESFAGSGNGPRMQDGVWVSRDGAKALLMVQSAAAGFDIDGQEQALADIDAAFAAAKVTVPKGASAELVRTGPPVFAVLSRAQIKGDAQRLSVIATVMVAMVLLLAFRSGRVLGLALLPVASGALAGVAAVAAVFGFVHGITLGFGVTLIGEAVDYAIYLFTRTPKGTPAKDTLPRIWPILRLGMLTSVFGFSAMLLSRFDGFAQLGLFTIAGLLVALAVTRFVLPALQPMAFASSASGMATPLLFLMRAPRRPVPWGPGLMLAVTAFAGVTLLMHRGSFWQDGLSSMSPLPPALVQQDIALRREIGAPDVRHLLLARGPDREAALAEAAQATPLLEALVANKAISGFDTPARWQPPVSVQRARQAALPDGPTLAANLAAAVAGSAFRAEIFAPFLEAVAKAKDAAPLTERDFAGTGIGLRADTLLVHGNGFWAAMLPLQGVEDPAVLAKLVASAAVPGLILLDLRAEQDALMATFRQEAVTLSASGAVAILLLLAASLRRFRRVLAVVMPLAAAVICTAAVLLADGRHLSIFHLLGLLLVVAVGSNYCLFFEHECADAAERRRMIASLVLADLCTVIGFGVLGLSGVPVLHDIGTTVAVGACLSLVFAAILAPPEQAA